MRRPRKRKMHYSAGLFYDGTIIAAYPIRKPLPKRIKEDNIKIDEDGVCDRGWYDNGINYSNVKVENRFRFQDIMANRLNTRRAIREIVAPQLSKIEKDIDGLRKQLDQIQQLLTTISQSMEK